MDFKIDPRIHASHATNHIQDRKSRDLESLKESSKEFETMFVMEMYKAMRQAIPEGGLFEKSNATEIFQDMLDLELARESTKGQGMGIAEAMYKQMASHIENKK
ncbi:rod-binding protein [Desulforhopalus sp. 52FAK]